MLSIDMTSLLLIFCVAIGTYSLRVSGLLLSNILVKYQNIKIFLDYLPATLLLSLVVPAILKEGLAGIIATVFITLCMYKTKSILLSMIVGVFVVILSRSYLL